jgi:hypothetical protein
MKRRKNRLPRRHSMSTIIKIEKELPKEFLSDIMITAFDGSYGASWQWFEPVGRIWLETEQQSEPGMLDPAFSYWIKAHVRLKRDCQTGYIVFDDAKGFEINHEEMTKAIQRILDDDYVGVWKNATEQQTRWYEDDVPWIKDGEYRVSNGVLQHCTGETARGYREDLLKIVGGDMDAGDIDAPFADAIVQVAAFGKVIFG